MEIGLVKVPVGYVTTQPYIISVEFDKSTSLSSSLFLYIMHIFLIHLYQIRLVTVPAQYT